MKDGAPGAPRAGALALRVLQPYITHVFSFAVKGKPHMKKFFALLASLALSAAAFALPTVEAVQAEVRQGHYAQAETMMQEVVAAKPGSARAHYVYAEVLAHNGRFERAAQEAKLARQIDPAIGFTQPEQFKAFERLIEREQSTARSTSATPPAIRAPSPALTPPAERSSGLPGWAWGLAGAAVAVLAWRLANARRQASALGTPGAMGSGYAAPAAGYGAPGAPVSSGSGMLGTGLAAAGGFAAGMLAEKLLEGRHGHDAAGTGTSGLVPGMFDDAPARNAAADELERRSIDFGSGGDWDSGGAGDIGGSADDGGW